MRVSDTDYTLVIVTEDGTQYDISDFAEDLGWEENEKELASHLSFSVGTDNEELTSLIKIGGSYGRRRTDKGNHPTRQS